MTINTKYNHGDVVIFHDGSRKEIVGIRVASYKDKGDFVSYCLSLGELESAWYTEQVLERWNT